MESSERPGVVGLCPRCERPLVESSTKTAVWQGARVAIVEDVPALVCTGCGEQYYDEDVGDALRRLNEDGFPAADADRVVEVPVFSLRHRMRTRVPLPEDTQVD
jgi:YgiT-type zinc finger domain-containing protein